MSQRRHYTKDQALALITALDENDSGEDNSDETDIIPMASDSNDDIVKADSEEDTGPTTNVSLSTNSPPNASSFVAHNGIRWTKI